MATSENIVITGANGKLGRLVVTELRKIAPAAHVIGLVRNSAAAADLAKLGVEIRAANYNDPASLASALAGADKVLLISSNEVGQRVAQHRNVIEAARAAGVKLLAYTSILHADRNPMALARDHRETEESIRAAGLPFVFLRNGWYTENYTGNLAATIQQGAVLGASGAGRISSAARADYAAAAAAVLAADAGAQAGRIHELAGDSGFTLGEYAAELARQSRKTVVYQDMSEGEYRATLERLGLPAAFAQIYADSAAKAAAGALQEDSKDLSRLIGRATTPLAVTIAGALAAS